MFFFFLCGITVVAKFEDDLLQAQIMKVIPEILQKICQKYIGEGSIFRPFQNSRSHQEAKGRVKGTKKFRRV